MNLYFKITKYNYYRDEWEGNINYYYFIIKKNIIILLYFRVIISSHPVCNTIMLVGVIICLSSVFLLGLDGQFISPEEYPGVCQAKVWLLSTGFTLGYGAMFSKVWRVHRLTTKAKSDTVVSIVVFLLSSKSK